MRTSRPPSAFRFRPAPLVAAVLGALSPMSANAMVHVVTNNADSGAGSLRAALTQANADCNGAGDGNAVIQFNGGASPITISVSSPLPTLNCSAAFNVTIDGTTQPGYVPNSAATGYNGQFGVAIDGTAITGPPTCGINFQQPIGQGTLTLLGMALTGFNAGGNSAGACASAVDARGSAFVGNFNGLFVTSGGAVNLGTFAPADRNFFFSNSQRGAYIAYSGAIAIRNSYFGTDLSGTAAAGNPVGLYVANNASFLLQSSVVSGNTLRGVHFDNQSPATITQTKIGVGAGGGALGNGGPGILINAFSFGGVTTIANNTISANAGDGIQMVSGMGVRIANNSIFGNGAKNINLNFVGAPLPNDLQDPDGGPNNGQNYPTVTLVTPSGPNTQIDYAFNSTPNTNFTLEFFANASAGTPAGQTFLTSVGIMTDGNGDFSGTYTHPGAVNFIAMTATHGTLNDTSEFSPAVAITLTPAVSVSPSALAFGNVPTGTTSPNLTSTLTSSGTGAWQITALGSPPACYGGPICYGGAEFTCMTTCQTFTPYNPTQSCTLSANFHPTFLGPQSITVQFCDNAAGSPRDIVLSGTGVAPSAFALSPAAFDFGNVPVGSQSPRAFFTLQNPGASPLGYTTGTSGPFSIVGTNCSNPVPAGGSCDFDLVFVPDAPGSVTGSFTVSPSSGNPASSSLMGNGTVAPQLSLPSSIDFQFTLGGAPSTQTLTLQNTGLATLDISSITISGPFTLVNNCPASLAPGASCTLILGFAAPSSGTFDGVLTIVTNAAGGSRAIALHGFSQPRAVPFLEVTPNEIGFGDQALGTASDGELVKIKNIGGAPAIFDSIVTSADFVILRHTCIGPLATGASCEAEVAIRALGYGTRSGKFTVNSNAENSPSQVNIFGTGCRNSGLTLGRLGISRGCR